VLSNHIARHDLPVELAYRRHRSPAHSRAGLRQLAASYQSAAEIAKINLDICRVGCMVADLRRMVALLAQKHAAQTVLIEDAGPGMALLQDLRRELPEGMPRPVGQKPEGTKSDRMVANP
jgi:hypothetical protein